MSEKSDASTRPATLAEGIETLDFGAKLAANQLLGPYRLVRPLGEGGMGVVWLADQLQPFERKVAIKLSKRPVGSSHANAYFEIERQALAQLVHPYIAQIYDAGVRADGTLYFAMEYVQGSTLDDFLQDNPISLDACIALLAQVCQGVHYAHQRGLIHRDLKPGNVLIAEVSGSPMPKIIDFGIAIGVDTARSGSNASAGTRAYMAPEQFSTHAAGIDLRVDVYALGAMLIEALCLQLKIPLNGIDSGTFRGLLSAAGTSAEVRNQQPHVPASLKGELRRIPKALRCIAIKAMAVDREQRYESAAAMADDLKRWRERRPVLAMQGGKLYAVQCFVNRYRLASALGLATLTALVGGLIIASYGLRQAQIARAQAEVRREQAESLVDYMLGDFAAKLEPIGKLDLIDGVASRALDYLLQANDADQSSAIHRAAALRTIGDVQTRRGQWPQAKSTFTLADAALSKAVKANPGEATAELLFEQGQVAYWIGYIYYNELDYAATKVHWQRYLDFAIKLKSLTLESGLGNQEIGYALNNLGVTSFQTGEMLAARSYFERSIKIKRLEVKENPDDEKLIFELSNNISWIARAQEAEGDLISAHASYLEQLAISEKEQRSRPGNAIWLDSSATARYWLGLTSLKLGYLEEALIQLQNAVKEFEELTRLDLTNLGNFTLLGMSRSELAWALYSQKKYDRALEVVNAQIDQSEKILAASPSIRDQRSFAVARVRKAIILNDSGASGSAQALYDEALLDLINLNKKNPTDIKILVALAQSLLLSPDDAKLIDYAAQAIELVAPLVEKQVDVDVLDTFVRANVLLGNHQAAQAVEKKLSDIKYNHPTYRAFLTRHFKGN